MKKFAFLLAFLCGISLAFAEQTQTAPIKPGIDKKTDQLLHKMSDLLASAKNFTFRTKEVHDKIRPSGEKVKAQVTREVAVRRPDGIWMHLDIKAPDKSRELALWYDGKTLILQSDKEKVYARTKMPPTIDEAIDYAGTTLNLPTPMADILYSSPYNSFVSDDASGTYVKLDKVEGMSCHELAFQNPILDWKIWVADGEQPLLCQLEITYKMDYESPVIRMTFLDWNLAAEIAADRFTHQPPADYQKIKMVGRVPVDEEQTQPSETQTQTQENQQ